MSENRTKKRKAGDLRNRSKKSEEIVFDVFNEKTSDGATIVHVFHGELMISIPDDMLFNYPIAIGAYQADDLIRIIQRARGRMR